LEEWGVILELNPNVVLVHNKEPVLTRKEAQSSDYGGEQERKKEVLSCTLESKRF